MFEAAVNAWKIADLRKKILYTLFIIVLFRFGSAIAVPFLDPEAVKQMYSAGGVFGGAGNAMNYLNMLAGDALSRASIFAMSISPYITASIVIQLLTVAIPALERMQKEGEEGKKKLAQITRYTTVALGLFQGYAYFSVLASQNAVLKYAGWRSILAATVIILSFTAGSALIMWLGEQINDKGIGNGISIILFASIVSRAPELALSVWGTGFNRWIFIPAIIIVAVALIMFIVFMNDAERRIPVQYAKKVVGRKMYGGQSTHIPFKISMTGVMPIIFASSFVMIPSMISSFFPNSGVANWITRNFGYTSVPYAIIFFILIIAFNKFYVSIQYNPMEISNNLKKNGGFIPGIRPGKPTSDFISRVIGRITIIGAVCLALIAVLPIAITWITNSPGIALGGTSVLIIVGVVLETMKQLESQLMMRHYKGFLE